jgi:phosphatidylglycerophosphate synthase
MAKLGIKTNKLKEHIKKADKNREGGVFYKTERKIIEKLTPRIPSFLTPDRLTLISILSYIFAGVCFFLTTYSKWWLLGVVFFLFANWFGDSFDGQIARYRKIQRPRYGYFVDHMVDAFGPLFMLVGLGLSPLMHMPIALGCVICYLLLSVNTHLAVYTQGNYKIAYGGLGGTEGRIVVAGFSIITLFFTYPMNAVHFTGTILTVWDIVGIVCLFIFSYMLIVGVIGNLTYLNKIDKKNYKEISLQEYWDKSGFLNKLRNSDLGKALSGESLENSMKNNGNKLKK